MKGHHQGFGVVEALLILVIVGILGGVGWFVYHSNKKPTRVISDTAPVQSETPKTADKTVVPAKDETDDWLLYESPGKEYKIRLADGWNISRTGTTDFIYAWAITDLKLKPGVPATVTQVDGGRDGSSMAFSLIIPTVPVENFVRGDKQTQLKTQGGLTIDKYIFTQTVEPEGPDLPKGSKEYRYVIKKSSKTITVVHDENVGEPNLVDLVEKVVKTIEIN